jgi:hypothetical protein
VYGWVSAGDVAAASAPSPAEPVSAPTSKEETAALAVKHAGPIIFANEGGYGSVNANDNGAMSIGKVQWHGNRALALLKTIVNADPVTARALLGTYLFNEITAAGSDAWSKRVASPTEAPLLSALLTTPAGRAAQDKLAAADITTYVNKGMGYGLADAGALIYFADGVNQYGTNSALWKSIAGEALQGAGDVAAMFNATKAQTQNYIARREKVYKAVLALNPDAAPCSGKVPGGNHG